MTDIKRYTKADAPRVQLNSDPHVVGWLIEEGPVQSIVRWPNGNEDCVVNTWIKKVKGPLVLQAQPDAATVRMQAPTQKPAGAVTGHINHDGGNVEEVERKPKVRKEPDEIARRVAEFDDAKLKAFAKANGCWQDKYDELPNNGLRRMNVLNRLRGVIKKDPAYKVVWP